MPTVETIEIEIRKIAEKYDIERVYLFGSHARGEESEKSDVDLLVENGPSMTILDLSSFMMYAKEALNVEIDVVTLDGIHEGFYKNIRRDLVLLFEK